MGSEEKRLIDADALKAHINGVSTHWLNDWSTLGVLAAVDKQPTVDAVEVVRCKDCDFRAFDDVCQEYYCNSVYGINGAIEDNSYCSYGERREGE